MSDSLTFNKYAGAVLATCFVIAGLVQLSGGVFSQEKVAKPGFKVEVQEEAAGGAAAPEVPPDWGTVLKTADPAAGAAVFEKCKSCHNADNGGPNGTGPNLWGVVGRPPASHPGFACSGSSCALRRQAYGHRLHGDSGGRRRRPDGRCSRSSAGTLQGDRPEIDPARPDSGTRWTRAGERPSACQPPPPRSG